MDAIYPVKFIYNGSISQWASSMLDYINIDNQHNVEVTPYNQYNYINYYSNYKDAVIYVRENISSLYNPDKRHHWKIIDNVTNKVVNSSH